MITTKRELLFRKEWCQMFKWNAIAHFCWLTAIDFVYCCQWKILLTIVRRTHMTLNDITRFESIFLDDIRGNIDIVGRRKIVIITRTKETIAIWHRFENSVGCDEV